jgi:hypothetical protein
VAVDDLVVVAHAEHVERREGEQTHEQYVGGREVLELVDQQMAALLLHPAPERTVDEQRLDGGVDLLVEVDRTPVGEVTAVGVEQLGESVDVVALGLDLTRVAKTESDGAQCFEVRADGVGVGSPLALAGQQRLHQPPGVAFLDQAGGTTLVLGQDPQAE